MKLKLQSATLLFAALLVSAPLLHADEPAAAAAPAQEQAQAPQQMTPEQTRKIEQFQKLQGEVQALQQQLGDIHEATLKANPDLQKQRDELEKLVGEKMRAAGSDPDKDIEKIQGLQAKVQDDKLPEKEREQHFQAFSSALQAFQSIQEKAMQDEDVQAAQKKLDDDTKAAMQKQDPNTEKLIGDIRKKQEEMLSIRDSLMPAAH